MRVGKGAKRRAHVLIADQKNGLGKIVRDTAPRGRGTSTILPVR
jgi:hypothetical protein